MELTEKQKQTITKLCMAVIMDAAGCSDHVCESVSPNEVMELATSLGIADEPLIDSKTSIKQYAEEMDVL